MADIFETLVEGIHDVQSGNVKEGLQDIALVLDTVLKSDVGAFREGLIDIREGIHDIQIDNVREGVSDIREGLRDLIHVARGSEYEEGLHDLKLGFHDILHGNTDAGFANVNEGLHDLAAVVSHDWAM
jgi:hypothetical protein